MEEAKEHKLCSCGHKNLLSSVQCEQCQKALSSEESKEINKSKNKKKSKNLSKDSKTDSEGKKEDKNISKNGKSKENTTKKREMDRAKSKTVSVPRMKFCTCGKRNKKMARYCVLCNRDISFEVAMTELEYECLQNGKTYDPAMEVKLEKKKKFSKNKGKQFEGQAIPHRVETNAWLNDEEEIDFSNLFNFYCRFRSIEGNFSILIEDFPFSIGRGQGPFGEYLLSKAFVSRNHAMVTLEQDGIYLKHLGNTNPTCVNQAVIYEKIRLNSGDEIAFGGNRLGEAEGKPEEMSENIAYISVEIGRK